jgi:hypothetical protein
VSALITVWAALAAAFTVLALYKLALRPQVAASKPSRVGIVLLRPVDAPTACELETLGQVPRGVEQCVLSPRPLTANHHPSEPSAQNRKLGHLRSFNATGPVLVADADVAVDDALVDALLGALEAGADLAWAAPRPLSPGVTRGLLVQSLHSFEALDVLSVGSKPVCGKAMALTPAAWAALLQLPDCIGEDLELSSVLHRRGLTVARAGYALMPHPAAPLARFTRWMQVLNAHRPALFPTVPLLFSCTPLLLAGALLQGDGVARAATAVLVALRLVTASVLERQRRVHLAWLGAEALLLVCWVRALLRGDRVTWRGRELAVGAQGALESPPSGAR